MSLNVDFVYDVVNIRFVLSRLSFHVHKLYIIYVVYFRFNFASRCDKRLYYT